MHRQATRVMVAAIWGAAPAFAGGLALGHVTAAPGTSVTVPVTYRQGRGPAAAALATDITFDAQALSKPRCAPGSALTSTGEGAKQVLCSTPKPGVLRLAVLGWKMEPIPDGEVAAVTFDIAPTATHRFYSLHHKPGAADATGTDFGLTHRNGAIRTR